MTKFEKAMIADSKSVEQLAKRLTGYGYYDKDHTPIEIIMKYITIGAEWQKQNYANL